MKRRKHSKIVIPTMYKVSSKDNAPPPNPDHQDVPHSLKEFVKLKRMALTDSIDTKKKSKRNNSANSVKAPDSIQEKSKIQNTVESSEKNAVAIQSFRKKKNKKLQKLKMKRKLKKLQKKEQMTEDIEHDIKDIRKEEIKFGEVVHRPPQISVLPRKVTKTGFENRPGRKDDLLLKSLLKRSGHDQRKRTPLTDKRKNLSISDQRQIEIERQKAMLAYRNMKVKKNKNKKVP